MTTLKSMTDYVLEQSESIKNAPEAFDKYVNIVNYAKFLSMNLEIKMFVPVDENGNLLEEPEYYELWKNYGSYTQKGESIVPECVKYHKALLEVIFEGFEYKEAKQESHYSLIRFPDRNITPLYPKLWKGMTIEDLVKYNLTLTEQARDKYKF